jgi:uncharacterized protein YbcI
MADNIQTAGQLERTLSQRIQTLYRNQLGHQPSKVSCQLLDEKVAIVLENSVTRPEQILSESDQSLAEQVRHDLDNAIHPQLIDLIQEILNVKVLDLLSDTTLSTGRSGMIGILDGNPVVRDPVGKNRNQSPSSPLSPAT